MRRIVTILLAGLLIAAVTAPAFAWEFTINGEVEYRYRYISRTGEGDIFGHANSDIANGNGGAIGLAGYFGGTNSVVVQGYSAKGSDAALNDYRVTLYPEIRVNPAIRLRGEYWVTAGNLNGQYDGAGAGAVGNDNWILNRGYSGWYFSPNGSINSYVPPTFMSTGAWEKFWVTAQTPWGILAFGRRPFPFGLGFATFHEKDCDTESVALVVPYGPLTFIFGHFLYENNWNVPNSALQLTTPPVGALPPGAASTLASPTDKNGIRDINGAFAVTYRAGNVDMGTISRYVWNRDNHVGAVYGAGPARRDDATGSGLMTLLTGVRLDNPALPVLQNAGFVLQTSYLKYDNGRFFFNGEYSFEYFDDFRSGGRPIHGWADEWMLEFGTVCGPTKLSLANFYKSGHDRRGGFFNLSNPTGAGLGGAYPVPAGVFVMDRWNSFLTFGGGDEAVKPYNWLMGLYGTGNNGYDANGYPQYTDFLAYAARLDYAVAANLNVFGSFIYANRASNTGTYLGQYRGGVTNVAGFVPNPGLNAAGAQIAAIPNVPDNYLGWEADAGWNWKLLENMTFNGLVAYWQPGDWFKYAYTDYTFAAIPGGGGMTVNGVTYPVNPNRGIDPLLGFQGSMVIDF